MAELIYEDGRLLFTKEMKEEYTLLIPAMAPYHFEYFADMFRSEGFKAEVLSNNSFDVIHEGMKYSHNDICVPAMLVIGQFIDAMKNGGYDIHKVALIMTQTGGGCRASNYISMFRKSLARAGYDFIPIISANALGMEPNPGFEITKTVIVKLISGIIFGDLMQQLFNETIPYEVNEGDTQKVFDECHQEIRDYFYGPARKVFYHPNKLFESVIKRFSEIAVDKSVPKPKVGIVGEIYVKYSPLGNNGLEELLRKQGCEVITPAMFDFFIYTIDSTIHDINHYGGKRSSLFANKLVMRIVAFRRNKVYKQLEKYGFRKPTSYNELRKYSEGFVQRGMHVGEGWLLTAEMIELIHIGSPNIVCVQPFGCLPNHIAGKGMMKKIRHAYPDSNIVAIDYDTSATEINQLNRINLMISNARKNLGKQ